MPDPKCPLCGETLVASRNTKTKVNSWLYFGSRVPRC